MFYKRNVRKSARLWFGAAIVAIAAALPAMSAAADESEWSIARIWNEATLEAIRKDLARPPVHARNLFHVSAAMYDAWAVYDPVAQGVFAHEKVPASDVHAARHEAISYAAYRILVHRFAESPGADTTLPALEQLMLDLGYDPTVTTTIGGSPAAVGNRCAMTVLDFGMTDGSHEANNYAGIDPITGDPYEPANEPLVVEMAGAESLVYPNRWQSIWLEVLIDQQGNILDGNVPGFVGPHWGLVTPFALREEHKTEGKPGVYLDPGPPPMLGESPEETELWMDTFTDVLETASVLDPDLGMTIDISPAVFGNNPLGSNDGVGHGPYNPVTGEPYEPNLVNYGDYGRIIAEFWADGPQSSTPPGHWNEKANMFVADYPDFHFQVGGVGDPVDRLEWDVKMYLAINGATFDVSVACWGLKGYYDWVRPISAIRYMADRGQSSDPKLPSYHPHGLPLIDGLTELITEESIQPGGKHECLAEMLVDEFGFPILDPKTGQPIWDAEQFIGEIAAKQWPGTTDYPVSLPPTWVHPDCVDPNVPYSGVQWIRAKRWSTYQLGTFITPPFAGYTSGHTTFSRAAAVVLSELTGSEYFPGGLAEYVIPKGWLDFEFGPSEDLVLQWTSFFDASDQSARSRIYGGIHPYVDDFPARFQGQEIGEIVAERVFQYFDGTAHPACPGDLNGDGVVDGADLLNLLSSWGPCAGDDPFCPADLNQDGIIDGADLSILFSSWGPCPEPAEASVPADHLARPRDASPRQQIGHLPGNRR